jgi:transcriptional regulator with GAF, ATPase, and Fis domain
MAREERCWKYIGCKNKECPAYESDNLECWTIPKTHCNNKIQNTFVDKVAECYVKCPFFQSYRNNLLHKEISISVEHIEAFGTLQGEIEAYNSQLAKISQELAQLYHTGMAMEGRATLDQILFITLNMAKQNAGFERIMLLLVNPKEKVIEGKIGISKLPQDQKIAESIRIPIREDAGIIARSIVHEEPFIINDADKNSRVNPEILEKVGSPKSFAVVPIIVQNKTIGAIAVDNLYSNSPIKPENVKILLLYAIQIGLIIELESALTQFEKKTEDMKRKLSERFGFGNIIGKSPQMQEIYNLIELVSESDATVLIEGESGTGKELIANAIHYNSSRKNEPFICVDCTALTETLLESELFGYEKGAFTGAIKQKIGKFEAANKGTIFLDEVSEMSPNLQMKLLRVLQERKFERVGGTRPVKVDIRIIAATNKNLEEMMKKGQFRKDLFFRLNVVPIHVPTLRERKEDIPLLIDHFLTKLAIKTQKPIKKISNEALNLMMEYDWPGNVRELENVLERIMVTLKDNIITQEHLPVNIQQMKERKEERFVIRDGMSLFEIEKEYSLRMLEKYNWNLSKVANILGIDRSTLRSRIKKYGIATMSI